VLKALQQTPGFRIGMLSQRFDDLPRLSAARLGYADQLPVSLFELLAGFLSFFAGDPVQPLSSVRLTLRLRVRKASLPKEPLCSPNTFLARLKSRESTLTPSPKRALSVGWWMFVSTTIESTLSLRPRVTFSERANSTARSLRAVSVSGPIVCAHRMSVVSSGAGSR